MAILYFSSVYMQLSICRYKCKIWVKFVGRFEMLCATNNTTDEFQRESTTFYSHLSFFVMSLVVTFTCALPVVILTARTKIIQLRWNLPKYQHLNLYRNRNRNVQGILRPWSPKIEIIQINLKCRYPTVKILFTIQDYRNPSSGTKLMRDSKRS